MNGEIPVLMKRNLRPRELGELLIVEVVFQMINVYGLRRQQQVKSCAHSPPWKGPEVLAAGDKMPQLPADLHQQEQWQTAVGLVGGCLRITYLLGRLRLRLLPH